MANNYKLSKAALNAKALALGMPSYPVIQRRTAALNKALGTSYSPKQVIAAEITAREKGYGSTKFFQDLENVRGQRADIVSSGMTQDDAAYFLQQQYASLANKQPQIYQITHGHIGEYIAPDGVVYRINPDGLYMNTRTGEMLEKLPRGSVDWTPENAYKALREAVLKMEEEAKRGPSYNYEELDLELEF